MYLRALIDQSCSETYFWVVDNWMYLHTGREICFWNTLYPSILKHKWASETANQIITVILRVLSLHLEPHNWESRIIMCSVDTWWLIHQKDALIYKVLCFFLLLDSFPDDLLCIQIISETSPLFERGNLIHDILIWICICYIKMWLYSCQV